MSSIQQNYKLILGYVQRYIKTRLIQLKYTYIYIATRKKTGSLRKLPEI